MIPVADDETDYLSALPAPLLSLIHDLAFQAGGLRSALALEAASKQLRELFLDHARFQQEVAAQAPPPPTPEPTAAASSFWPWIAAHGQRLDRLALTVPRLDLHAPALCDQPGLLKARTAAIIADRVATLQPLAGLLNLTRLSCLRLLPHNQIDDTPSISLNPLLALTALQSLTLSNIGPYSNATTSLAPLAALTALTALQLVNLGSEITDVAFLPALGPRLRSFRLAALRRVRDLAPIARLTSLTSLSLESVFNMDALGTVLVGSLQRLRLLAVESTSRAGLALEPLGALSNLRSLEMQKLAVVDLQPLARLAGTLQVLRMYRVDVDSGEAGGEAAAQDAGATISSLRHLSVLELASPHACSAVDFLAPLTNLQRLCIDCTDEVESLAPLAELAALRQLHVLRAHGVASLEPLAALGGLQQLRLMSMKSVSSLQPLVGLAALRAVRLSHCGRVGDLGPLCALGSLEELEVVHYRGAAACSLPEQLRGVAVQVCGYPIGYELPEWGDQ